MAVSLGEHCAPCALPGPYKFGQYQLVIALLLLVNVSDFGIATVAIRHLSWTPLRRSHDGKRADGAAALGVVAARRHRALVRAGVRAEVKRAMAVASLSFLLTIFSGSFNAAFVGASADGVRRVGNIAQAVVFLAGVSAVVADRSAA